MKVVRLVCETLSSLELRSTSRVLLFGSALNARQPHDVDVVVLYCDTSQIVGALQDRDRIVDELQRRLPHLLVDAVTMSHREAAEGFLDELPNAVQVWPGIPPTL